jgi:hypothetical protein
MPLLVETMALFLLAFLVGLAIAAANWRCP